MHRLMDYLDKQLSVLVPLLYLLGTLAGTVYFFVGSTFQSGLPNNLFELSGVVGGIALAVSVEMHAYLQQRRFRVAWDAYRKVGRDDEEAYRTYYNARVWLGVLMGFEVINGCAFWITLEHPTNTGDMVMLLFRGTVVPVLFLGSGYLTRLSIDAVEILSTNAENMLRQTMKAVGVQWKNRIKDAKRGGKNLAPVAIALMVDAGEDAHARRIQLIENGLSGTETGRTPSKSLVNQAVPYQKTSRAEPSTVRMQNEGGKTPANVTPISQHGGHRMRAKLREQERVNKVLKANPDATLAEIMKGAKCSENTARKYRNQWREMNGLSVAAEG